MGFAQALDATVASEKHYFWKLQYGYLRILFNNKEQTFLVRVF